MGIDTRIVLQCDYAECDGCLAMAEWSLCELLAYATAGGWRFVRAGESDGCLVLCPQHVETMNEDKPR